LREYPSAERLDKCPWCCSSLLNPEPHFDREDPEI
jgi:hypothetical protein